MNNFEMMRKRLEYYGGVRQEDRMIQDKYRTLQKALLYSYQACEVQLVQHYSECLIDEPNDNIINDHFVWRALINPDKTKQDYDDKIISINYHSCFGPGDVFKWRIWNKKIMDGKPDEVKEEDRSTHWLIYLPALNEDAYFRAEIRLCRHIIKFKDANGLPKYTWAAIRGPVETQIDSIQKNQVRIDVPNLTLNILLPRNDDTLSALDRYARFILDGKAWKVLTCNSISTRNIIEITAGEDFINEDKDDQANALINGLVVEPVDPNPPASDSIIGETFILPKRKETYAVPHIGGCWKIKPLKDGTLPPVYVEPIDGKENDVAVTWNKSTSGQFTLIWTDGVITLEKVIVVESLF